MERLIIKCTDFNVPKKMCTIDRYGEADDCSSCREMCREIEGICSECPITEAFNRLAEYETTGITPEQIIEMDKLYAEKCKELTELKKQIPPCKVGDTVYVKMQSGEYAEAEVRDFSYFLSCGFCVVVTSDKFDKQHIPFTEFGKTVFLTKTEAEEALKRMDEQEVFEKIIERLRTEKSTDRSRVYSAEQCDAIRYSFGAAIDVVKVAAAEHNNGWIPCSERMPEESLNSVLGWDEYRKRCCFVEYWGGRWILGNDIDSVKITAWQPLPEPYQPKGEQSMKDGIHPRGHLPREPKRQTNADRIRSMSNEELANENVYFVSEFVAKEGLRYTGLDGHYYRTGAEVVEANRKWLQEVEG